ncbi:EKC/KEOPS complex subunit BUD32 [Colletotrichum liriopes]|uniref:non-specific serine/threonine protein kinase n=1 Tax=Colletotrichum liriopes TaxID=708192 RepID=A0AA37LV56_9PEZI|nr:EKC/KEOPS complex subunit BUD32 [Colletotrichum liriopes]
MEKKPRQNRRPPEQQRRRNGLTTRRRLPLPPLLTHPSSPAGAPALVTQGAEARLYRTTFLSPSLPAALKYRPKKPYRHPTLDARLTRARILAEARVLAKCRREGCPVPALYALDEAAGWLMLEWIPGAPVRVRINEWLDGVVQVAGGDGARLAEIPEADDERRPAAAAAGREEVVVEGPEGAARQREADTGAGGRSSPGNGTRRASGTSCAAWGPR